MREATRVAVELLKRSAAEKMTPVTEGLMSPEEEVQIISDAEKLISYADRIELLDALSDGLSNSEIAGFISAVAEIDDDLAREVEQVL